ncbi:MAG: transcription elongation factor GreB [Deltaproteobacteria bacterium]|nr:transcription elongation factor GreB [Deltaproteobacteria bacterium]
MVFRRAGTGPQSNYITPEGARKLREEAEQLWNVERPKVTQEVADAAAQGDRSENAEYIYGKKRLREIDKRMRYLNQRLDALIVVEPKPPADGSIRFGAWVELEDEDGEVKRYRIVGADEFDIAAGKISLDSPMAKALLGKCEGDEVTVKRPKGPIVYEVVSVSYGK